MMKKATKYGILIFAAVLVVAMAFAGAASADEKTVSSWADLKSKVEEWTDKNTMRTIYVDKDITIERTGSFPNKAYYQINVYGNVTIMPATNAKGNKVTINADQKNRIFEVNSGASLTLAGNSGKKLILTGGGTGPIWAIAYGGAVKIDDGGTLFLNDGCTITNCKVSVITFDYGGGVYVDNGGLFVMNGGAITGCSADYGGGVYVADGAKFILENGEISGCSASIVGDLVYVYGDGVFEMNNGHLTDSAEIGSDAVHLFGGTFNMTGGTIDTCVDEGVYINGGMFNMTGGTITRCGTQGVHVAGGVFEMNDGSIIGSKNSGVVVENDAVFTMNGGKITGCTTPTSGGGVYVDDGTFEMNADAVISDCGAGRHGGGVYVKNSTFTMHGGNITGCYADVGGGVYDQDSTFIMDGGDIFGCTAKAWLSTVIYERGGGVYVGTKGTFTMTGGNITKCTAHDNGGGVFVERLFADYTGIFSVSGTATVKDNTKKGETNNVYLDVWPGLYPPHTQKMAVLNFIGPFSGDIGIANPAGEPDVQFGTADAYYEDAANFSSDDGRYLGYLMKNSDTYLLVWADKYAISVDTVYHGTLTANRTEAAANTSVQVVAAADPGYHLNATCWYNASDADNRTYFEDSFKLPGNHGIPVHYVNVSGDFQPNVTVISLDQNGGHGGTAAVNATYGESTFNTSIANPQRTGHIFVGWNLSDSGDELIDVNGTLVSDLSGYTTDGNWTYTGSHGGEVGVIANWSAIIYNVTVIDDGYGTASANISSGSIGTPFLLTVDSVTEGYEFKEWYILDGGVIIDENNVSQIYDRDVIIKALFQKTGSAPVATGSITVNIVWPTDGPLTSAYIQLMPSTKYEELPAPSGSYTHTFTEVEPGVYSVDITYVYADTNATVRKANVLADNTAGPDYTASVSVTLPGLCANTEIIKDENTSIREIKADGLVEEAEYWAFNLSGNVTVTLTLTEDAMSGSQYQFIQDIRQMMPSVNVSGLQPINATVWLSSDDGIRGLSETETVFELYVPFDGQGKYDIRVFRSHNGTTAELQRLNARPVQGTWMDGTYFIGPQGIYIYTDKFSFYAIGYSSTASAVYTPSSSHQTGYTVILPDSVNTTQKPTQNPTPAATQAPTQMPTTQPTQKSPAPVIGLIAGLGIAAVLLRLRR
ncbi:MAG TPA: hypothetical protein O0X27_02300 [Methanocorpusculum sp.]|nr:hypothetical protein [Methanocorpusculum sp.]